MLAIEDVHWADAATLDVLRYLVRRIEELPVVLVLTYRDDELRRDDPLRQLLGVAAGNTRTRRLPLPRLSVAGVTTLCAVSGVDPADVYAVTDGNPYYVTQVLESGGSDPVPVTVVDAVLARIQALDLDTRAAVEQLSVLPGVGELWLVEALLPGGLASVAGAEERGLLTVGAAGAAFRHELTRRAIADAMPGSRPVPLETRVLRVLAGRAGVEPARLVHHAVLAGDREALVRYAPVAAREAARSGAHREAVASYARALEYADAYAEADRADLLEESAIESYTAGSSPRSAVADQREAVRLRRGLGSDASLGASLRWLSRICWWTATAPGRKRPERRPSACWRGATTADCWRWPTATSHNSTCSPTGRSRPSS